MVGIQNLEAIIADIKSVIVSAEKIKSGSIFEQIPELIKAYSAGRDAVLRIPASKAEVLDLDIDESKKLILELMDLVAELSKLIIK